ncbi:hypothetical protein pb186bvf_008966 [Paramecium bursaria]
MHIFLILLLSPAFAYFEQKLIRRAINITLEDLDTKDEYDLEQLDNFKCPKELLSFEHNDTYVTQLCFDKNVFYNIQVLLGEGKDEDNVFEMNLDLTEPWSWYKKDTCAYCKNDPLDFDLELGECKKGNSKCFYEDFTKNYVSEEWQDDNETGKIYSDNQFLIGKFRQNTIELLAYDSTKRMTVAQLIDIGLKEQEAYKLIKVEDLVMLEVETMRYSNNQIQSDGTIGFGFGYQGKDNEKIRADSDFVEQLVKQETSLQLTRQQFAIYTNIEDGAYRKDFIIQVGGFDYTYSHKHEKEIRWINVVENSGYYWMISIPKMGLGFNFKTKEENLLTLENPKSIVTLNSQFIELPKEVLLKFRSQIQELNNNTKCSFLEKNQYMLYCTNLIYETQLRGLQLELNFPQLDKSEIVTISSDHLLMNCSNQTNPNVTYNCLFRLKLSKSGYIILGEPFMKAHFVIFENQPANKVYRIGILNAAADMNYVSKEIDWALFHLVLYVFVFGLLTMCCIANLKRGCKDLYRALKYRRAMVGESDQKVLRSRYLDDEVAADLEDDIQKTKEVELRTETKKVNDWTTSQQQFDFGKKFTQIAEDHSI